MTIPAGSIFPFGGTGPAAGYLLCDGSAVSRTTYATLFGIIGTTFGSGDGSTTFNLPDLTGGVSPPPTVVLRYLIATEDLPNGSVNSVGLSTDANWFNVSGSPVTTSGTLAFDLATGLTANQVLATPNGAPGAVGLRALVGTDLPNPGASSKGGVQSFSAPPNQWVNAISTSGVVSSTQPSFGDISGGITTGQLPSNTKISTVGTVVDGGGIILTTGQKGYVYCPFAGTITAATLIADASGSIVMDVWKSPYNTVPTVANTITASALPTLSSAQTSQNATLTGWTTSVAAGDVFGFNINSVSGIKRITLSLTIARS